VQLFLQRLFDALGNGAVYASLAVALTLVYRSSGMLNFALGESSMFATFLALVLVTPATPRLKGTTWARDVLHTPWPIVPAIVAVVVVAMAFGAVVERVLIRRVEGRSTMAVVGATLGLGLLVNGAASQIFGAGFYAFKSPFPHKPADEVTIGGAKLRYETLVVLRVVLKRTRTGLAFRAVASNRMSAGLAGIRVGRSLALGWGMAGALGAIAGVLVAPSVYVDTSMMSKMLVFAIAAATVGGLDSPGGAVIGGFFLALAETLLGGYVPAIGGDLSLVTAIAILLVVLAFRPQGLLGRRRVARL
jgi:branched-chain amino acid transport system permease protein